MMEINNLTIIKKKDNVSRETCQEGGKNDRY